MRQSPSRSWEPIGPAVLDRLAEMAAEDLADRINRKPRWRIYADRVICVALCQGAARHYIDGSTGVKDFDVWTFFAQIDDEPFPQRWRVERQFDLDPFTGLYVDLIGRSVPFGVGVDPVDAITQYLAGGRTASARALAKKGVVLLEPRPRRGQITWPPAAT